MESLICFHHMINYLKLKTMLESKLNLFGKEWLDVVFDQKNKTYGAYQLRQENSSNTTVALFFTSAVFVLLFLTPKIINLVKGPEQMVIADPLTVETIEPPKPLNPEMPPPPSVTPPAAKEPQIKFPPPVVVADPKVAEDQTVMIDDLKDANPGQKEIAGDEGGQIVITGSVGPSAKQAAMTGDETIHDFVNLEVQPSFPGGMNKFYTYLNKSIRYPTMAQEKGTQGKVFVSFVIEKNGELTDIQVVKNLGDGTDEEAVRVLKASPKWLPGIQNGRPVRVKYNIPISFALGN